MTREDWLRQEIEGFRRKIEMYQAFIAEYEQQLGNASAPRTQPPSGGSTRQQNPEDNPLAGVTSMIWFNKSQPEAAKLLLERVGYPLRTGQIVEGIEKGGVKVGGKDANAKKYNLYTILGRSAEFGRVRRDTWGLVGWPGVTRKSAEEDEDGQAPKKGAKGAETDEE